MRRRMLPLLLLTVFLAAGAVGRTEAGEAPARAAPAPAPALAGALTLAEACRLAAEANNEVLAARLESVAESERTDRVRSRYWPRIELSELYRRTDDPSIRPNFLTNENRAVDTDRHLTESYRTQGELTYTLFDGGVRSAALRAAEGEFSASMRTAESVRAGTNAAASSRERLGRLLGRPGPVAEPLAEGTDSPLELAPGSTGPETAEACARRDSPELARSRLLHYAREAAVDAERATWWPRLDASASRYYDDGRPGRLDGNQDSTLVGLQLSWPIFDGGLRRARVAEARSREAAAAYRANEAELAVSQRARDAARALAEAERGSAVAARRVAAYEATYQRVQKSWDAGRATFHELLEAQTDLADARLAELATRFDQRRAAARLLEATGFWVNWRGPGVP